MVNRKSTAECAHAHEDHVDAPGASMAARWVSRPLARGTLSGDAQDPLPRAQQGSPGDIGSVSEQENEHGSATDFAARGGDVAQQLFRKNSFVALSQFGGGSVQRAFSTPPRANQRITAACGLAAEGYLQALWARVAAEWASRPLVRGAPGGAAVQSQDEPDPLPRAQAAALGDICSVVEQEEEHGSPAAFVARTRDMTQDLFPKNSFISLSGFVGDVLQRASSAPPRGNRKITAACDQAQEDYLQALGTSVEARCAAHLLAKDVPGTTGLRPGAPDPPTRAPASRDACGVVEQEQKHGSATASADRAGSRAQGPEDVLAKASSRRVPSPMWQEGAGHLAVCSRMCPEPRGAASLAQSDEGDDGLARARAGSGGGNARSWADEADREEVPAVVSQQMRAGEPAGGQGQRANNPGSVGHPVLCQRPCRFYEKRLCTSGEWCNFCHLPHGPRSGHLCRSQRQLLVCIPPGERVALLGAVIWLKVQQLDGAAGAVDAWVWASDGLNAVDGQLPDLTRFGVRHRQVEQLALRLDAMSITNLCSIVTTFVEGSGVAAACDRLLEQLRAAAAAARP